MDRIKLEKLKAENYSSERELNSEDKKTLKKIFRYLGTFPVKEDERENTRNNLICMAQNAESTGTTIETVIGTDTKDYCDKLLKKWGITVPKGRSILWWMGTLYLIYGIITAVIAFYMFVGLFVFSLDQMDMPKVIGMSGMGSMITTLLIGGATSVLSIVAGVTGRRHCGNIGRASQCFMWGIVLAIGGIILLCITVANSANMSNILVGVIRILPAIIYIVGARKNMQS